MKIVDEECVYVMEGEWSPRSVIREIVDSGDQEDPFYVMDLGVVVDRYQHWKEMMPRVEPFYAVKCNDDRILVRTLAALGAGFDCASKAEIQLVTSIGVKPERIIFANPAKMASHIRYAGAVGAKLMTFDSQTELHKIKKYCPDARLVVRIRCDAAAAQCPLGIKFGCEPLIEAPRLIKLANVLNLNVVGVSFHGGSGANECAVFARGIALANNLFELAERLGAPMSLLDIGGGFSGHTGASLHEVSRVINSALQLFGRSEVRVIAEPGRYFAAAAYTLAACVHSTRQLSLESGEEDPREAHTMYFINDGVYGSFNCVLYDHQHVTPEPLDVAEEGQVATPCSVWGPSCDGLDCVVSAARLPPLALGSWLTFSDMGAYTLPVASPFNGFPVPRVRTILDQSLWTVLRGMWPLSELRFVVGERPAATQHPPHSPAPAGDLARDPARDPPCAVYVECALK
ncbi:ornithine decarboxylase 1-like isoform X1 [Leptidea sinapis]|uniref:ornithine decarboxylase 1-like isoform X1 n=1 Tax=Leptidea sinapis TaxID=189913 RepID=UPI00212F2277|nr:ornithine decarboxylase 1-like isoform X1 [Leptidea sinapis]XP_050671507.1 ornithine decarboxylase 1-like isoform X1 [Leptidea sinapis]